MVHLSRSPTDAALVVSQHRQRQSALCELPEELLDLILDYMLDARGFRSAAADLSALDRVARHFRVPWRGHETLSMVSQAARAMWRRFTSVGAQLELAFTLGYWRARGCEGGRASRRANLDRRDVDGGHFRKHGFT